MFSSQLNELSVTPLSIAGTIPNWLSGSFISNGPAQFEVGSTKLKHWFDGMAMLKKFEFKDGKVTFQNRFLRSKQYLKSKVQGSLYYNEFATRADLMSQIFHGNYYDNGNVNITCIDQHFLALTESASIVEFDFHDLSTKGTFHWDDELKGQVSTAHPHYDPVNHEVINVLIEVGSQNKYHIYKVLPHSKKRELISTYSPKSLFYIHSFSITPRYVILFKTPLVLSKMKLLCRYPFMDALTVSQEKTSNFVLIERATGQITEIETDAFVCLHSANAYEQGDELILDLSCYPAENPYQYFYLASPIIMPNPSLRRYVLNLKNKTCRYDALCEQVLEFPRLNYRWANGQKYQYLYTAAKLKPEDADMNAIQKTEVQTGKTMVWARETLYPAEPVFIAKPNSQKEDEGVILIIGYDAAKKSSALILLNAEDMQQMAEIPLPFHLPIGLHGNFYHQT